MELRHLRYFVAIAESLSFTKAAATVRVAQPALSRQLRDLEAELGARLLERNSRGVCLTPAGETFVAEARAVLARADQAIAAVRRAANTEVIHIGYAPTLATPHLPGAIERWNALHPLARAELHDLSTAEMLAGLRAGKLDVIIGARPAREPDAIESQTLRAEGMVLALPPRHALAKTVTIPVAKLADVPLITFAAADYPEYVAHVAAYLRKHRVKFAPVQEFDGVMSLVAAVESGVGVALVSDSITCLFPRRVPLRILNPAPARFPIAVSWRPKAAPPLVRDFVAALKESGRRRPGR
ncbi:MAG: LysR substrate-binding domain-containing protein [Chthoniobacteraceae bacterium]